MKALVQNRLILTGGNYDDWVYQERGVCTKEYEFRDADGQYMEKYVYARRGIKYPEPIIEKNRHDQG